MIIYYLDGFFMDNPPEGAVEVSEEDYLQLLAGQSEGQQIVANEQGYPILKKITIDQAQQFTTAKKRKLQEINQKAQDFVADIAKLDEVPEFEKNTWQEQANEARAWFNDNNTPTPKLAVLAALRGIPLDVLRQKCFDKAQAFYQLSFAVAGQRQRFEDLLEQAVNIEQISAIQPVYRLEVENEQ